MPTQEELLVHLWKSVINSNMDETSLQRTVEDDARRPGEPFADTGPAISRLLALGASPRDICLIMRYASYSAVFSTLYALDDPGVDGDNVFMLHESLLTSDPSGMEGRPGSAGVV